MTTVITCSGTDWQVLGPAPALVSNNSRHPILVRVDNSAPDALTLGHVLEPSMPLRLEKAGTIYGKSPHTGAEPSVIILTPIEAAAIVIDNVTISSEVEIKNDTGNPVPMAPNVTRGGGTIDANTQRVTLATDGPMVTAIGTPADAPAASDNAAASMIAFFKRAAANWTSLLAIILPSARAKVEPLGTWVTAQTAVVGATTAFVTLAAGTRRVSITARTADLYFKIGTGSLTASVGNGNGFLSAGATKDFAVPASAKIAFIRAGSTDATIEIDELGEPS